MIPRSKAAAANHPIQVDPHYDSYNTLGHVEPPMRGALLEQLHTPLSQLRDAMERSSR